MSAATFVSAKEAALVYRRCRYWKSFIAFRIVL
jgi:hypothetical protein